MEPVNILAGINRGNDRLVIHMRWQGQLNQDAINSRIGIECFHQCDEFILRNRSGQLMFKAVHARFDSRLFLRPDIDLACGVFAHQHNRETGASACFGYKSRD